MIGWENGFNVDLMPGTTLNFISDIPGAYAVYVRSTQEGLEACPPQKILGSFECTPDSTQLVR